jgi:hypothetical protein
MNSFALLFVVIFSLAVKAEDPEVAVKDCEFNIECTNKDSTFSIEYKVLGDGCDENSAGELILNADDKRTALQINGLPLKRIEDFGNGSKVCESAGVKYPAVEIDEHRIALFVRIENRPSLDRLGALIIDTNKKKVIKIEPNFGEIKTQNFAMLKSKRGVKTRLAKEHIKGIDCDCDAAVTDAWKEITPFHDMFKSKWVK